MIYVKVSDSHVFIFTCKIIFYCLCCCYCPPDIGTLNGGIRHILGIELLVFSSVSLINEDDRLLNSITASK